MVKPTTAPARVLSDDEIADIAVAAMYAEADLTPKPGLVDQRGGGAHSDMDVAMLHRSAEALRDALTECASTARASAITMGLRARIGAIGRAGEAAMLAATGGVNTHRGALWALGLLSAGAAADPQDPVGVAAQLAALSDPHQAAPTSHGARARRRYGATGAKGEAQSGFPHVRLYALPALSAARNSGADESTARLAALLALIAHLDDTCILHRGGVTGLSAVQSGAGGVLGAGGLQTPEGRQRFVELDRICRSRRLSPGGSGDLLAATLFLDAVHMRVGV
ncbi:triphosphoribosyl-dephospho-CoA synthase [Mycolicibacterium stellerae]|uniref:triphosphoribosyl-dephospho-CoA synthase n=1 Tax=Mycolicibacterium stellerae TaxID=2358193 RepID=UPI000F0BCF8E|nr:triphosphoribosyl-dephospho-CoA synthase [Mycolicibacterium stellerae]